MNQPTAASLGEVVTIDCKIPASSLCPSKSLKLLMTVLPQITATFINQPLRLLKSAELKTPMKICVEDLLMVVGRRHMGSTKPAGWAPIATQDGKERRHWVSLVDGLLAVVGKEKKSTKKNRAGAEGAEANNSKNWLIQHVLSVHLPANAPEWAQLEAADWKKPQEPVKMEQDGIDG